MCINTHESVQGLGDIYTYMYIYTHIVHEYEHCVMYLTTFLHFSCCICPVRHC